MSQNDLLAENAELREQHVELKRSLLVARDLLNEALRFIEKLEKTNTDLVDWGQGMVDLIYKLAEVAGWDTQALKNSKASLLKKELKTQQL